MARPVKIDKFESERHGVTVDIYLNKQTGVFTAEYNGERVGHTELAKVRATLAKLIQDHFTVEWHPFIVVHFVSPDRGGEGAAFIGIDLERLWLAKVGDHIMQSPYDWHGNGSTTPPGPKDTGRRFYYWEGGFAPDLTSHHTSFKSTYVVMPLADDLWERLQAIEYGIRQIKGALNTLISQGPQSILNNELNILAMPSTVPNE